jgi:hypothetical protein
MMIDFLVFSATFSTISAISWRPVLVVEEAGVPGENHHGQVTGKLYYLRLRVECTHFCNLQSRARTHAGRHDIAEIVLKVALNTKKSIIIGK